MELKAVPEAALPLGRPLTNSLKVCQAPSDKEGKAIKKAAREFESLFVEMMLKSMRDTVGKDKLTGGGRGEETFRSLLDQEYARSASQTGGLGIATSIEKELTRRNGCAKDGNGAD